MRNSSPLGRRAGRSTTTQDELHAMAAAAWRAQGIATFRVDDIKNEFDRLHIETLANELYGKRQKT